MSNNHNNKSLSNTSHVATSSKGQAALGGQNITLPLADYESMKQNIEQLVAYVQQQMEKEKAREAIRAGPKKKKRVKRNNI